MKTYVLYSPLRGKVSQFRKRERVLCWSIYASCIISLWPYLNRGPKQGHCAHPDNISNCVQYLKIYIFSVLLVM